eukprot:7889654-Pyramimonas_sp.AAC.1
MLPHEAQTARTGPRNSPRGTDCRGPTRGPERVPARSSWGSTLWKEHTASPTLLNLARADSGAPLASQESSKGACGAPSPRQPGPRSPLGPVKTHYSFSSGGGTATQAAGSQPRSQKAGSMSACASA